MVGMYDKLVVECAGGKGCPANPGFANNTLLTSMLLKVIATQSTKSISFKNPPSALQRSTFCCDPLVHQIGLAF